MKKTCVAAWLGAMVISGTAAAQEEGAPAFPKWTGGGDLRLRQEQFDHVPIKVDPPGETRGGLNNYIRFRTRLWSQYDFNDMVTVYGRAVNEFRHYYDPDTTSWDFPDEVVVDNLYININKLLSDDSLSVRVGRQDLFFMPGRPFGTGRLILEGSPKDGSRTIFFDAARLTWAKDKATINLIGINNHSDAQLLINDQDRDIVGYTGVDNKLDESGAVLYGTYEASKGLWLESYYIFKHESEWTTGTADVPELDVNTVGGRVASRYNDMFSSNLELAGQLGDQDGTDVSGYMVDALVKADLMKGSNLKPWTSLGMTWYSGDDPDTSDDEGWNPLWGRYPQIGQADLLAYSYDADGAANWSNLTFYNASAGFAPYSKGTLSAMIGQLESPESNGPGGGHHKGLYAGASFGFALPSPKITAKDSAKGHLVAEMLEPGDYYTSERETGYFFRWEIQYTF
jgi:hypothetical protein